MRKDQSGGYALPAVLVISFILASLTATYVNRAQSSTESHAELLFRRQTFFAADGMSRIAIQEIQHYMEWNPDPSTEDLQNTENVPLPEIPGYDIEEFEIVSKGAAFDGPLPNGPFAGMYSRQKPVQLHLLARKANTNIMSEVDLQVHLGQISMFQFFVFGDDYTELYPGPSMRIFPGRIHANGDLCIGSGSTLEVESLTASGRVLASDSRCRRNGGSGLYVWDGSNFTHINSAKSHGCTNCDSTGLDWRPFALSRWRGGVKDTAHSVPHLKLPISGLPRTHAGKNAAGQLALNTHTTRLLVDPVSSEDSNDIREQKYAWKADIRILDGVWYINNGSYPGQPIWSDHPGEFTDPWGNGVGQAQLAQSLGWDEIPQGYSYYAYNEDAGRLYGDSLGSISYGTLITRSDGRRKPGFWSSGAYGQSYDLPSGQSRDYFCGQCNYGACSASLALRDAEEEWCQQEQYGSHSPLKGAQYLQGARGGFIDARIFKTSAGKGRILPINFDMEHFAAALQDTNTGELGTYFAGGTSFNGVVYISTTWEGSTDGIPDQLARLWPSQGNRIDAAQSRSYDNAQVQTALPQPLCSQSLGPSQYPDLTPFSGPDSDGNASNGFEPYFAIPDCIEGTLGTPNAVRIINGHTIDPFTFPEGISVVTNLPLYLVGDTNTQSQVHSSDAQPWIPVMFGADAISFLSNNWNDSNSRWDNSVGLSSRVAVDTTFNVQVLAGIVQTTSSSQYSGGVENFPRFLEKWSGKSAYINGSFVLGFASIYAYQPWSYGGSIYQAPKRNWAFDPHLRSLINQPPGAPFYSVHSISRLRRR